MSKPLISRHLVKNNFILSAVGLGTVPHIISSIAPFCSFLLFLCNCPRSPFFPQRPKKKKKKTSKLDHCTGGNCSTVDGWCEVYWCDTMVFVTQRAAAGRFHDQEHQERLRWSCCENDGASNRTAVEPLYHERVISFALS